MPTEKSLDYQSPIYLQMRELLRGKIDTGEYPPGMAIPSETELAERYGVNRLTVRRAVDILVREGMLRRVHGKGVYVICDKIEQDLSELQGFTSTVCGSNHRPSVRILSFKQRKAGTKYASIFGIHPDDELYYIRRVCSADGEPLTLEEIFVPVGVAPRLAGIDLTVFSLREAFGILNIRLKRGCQTLNISKLGVQAARILDTEENRTAFLVHYTSTDERERIVEYGKCYIRSDRFSFRADYDT